jgi:alkanesulfonate monooxygenase SsuD/methylene tetrahydromethanopterin reductase-like flavin-dependent oxidoreductase (luciferase family)
MTMEFGYFLEPRADEPAQVLATGRLLDELGYDLVGIQDHPYSPQLLDAFSLAASVLAQTERLRVVTDVANLPLRPVPMLAKAAATLDALGAGRFELGLGAGAFWDQIAAMGGPRRCPGESLDALEEAIGTIRALWAGRGAVPFGPSPAHEIGIWVGAAKPRALRLTGRLADGWLAPLIRYLPPAQAVGANALIDEAALVAGRDPRSIRRISNVNGHFTTRPAAPASDTDTAVVGPAEHWVEVLTHLALDIGFDSFILASRPDPEALRAFIEDVAPAVRANVASLRPGGA